ncbi:MAG: hypothetical protein R2844_09470 [Caldilineales bacterium]
MTQHDKNQLERTYIAFMVRMWRDSARSQWRASAQSVHTGETVRFANIPMLLRYLHSHVGHGAPDEDTGSSTPEAIPDEQRDALVEQEANHV